MAVSTEKLDEYKEFKLEFTPPPPAETRPETNDPFSFEEDGTINLDLSGKLDVTKRAKFDSNVTIDGELVVQGVNILNELNSLSSQVTSLSATILSLQS